MITLLAKAFKLDIKSESDMITRRKVISLCCFVGIGLNIILFLTKFIAGRLSGAMSVSADAFNNLSDAGSSIITLLGIRLATKRPDASHPFGHGRMEYLSGVAVSAIIVVIGVQLLISSVKLIFNPTNVDISPITFIVLTFSVLIKLYMFYYNRSVGKKLNSSGMKATAVDSISDVVATSVVLICNLITYFSGKNIDPYVSTAVSLFIIYQGAMSMKDTVDPLLGSAPSKEFVKEIEAIVESCPEIEGIHDMVIHDYGPGRVMVSLHAEVDGKKDIFLLHDCIDNVEKELGEKLNCQAVIHMDPIDLDSPELFVMRDKTAELVKQIDEGAKIHDFRMVSGPTHTNVVFDILVSDELKMTDDEVRHRAKELVEGNFENVNAIITVDRPFV